MRRAWVCPAPRVARRKALRRRVVIVLAIAGTLVGLVALLAVIDLLRIRHDLARGQDTITALDFNTVDQQGGIVPIAKAAATDLHRAAHRAGSSPWLSALSYVPVISDQVHAVRDLTSAADRVGHLGETTARDVQAALDQAAGAGPAGRVRLVDTLSAATSQLEQGIQTIDVAARGWLLPPLSQARRDLVRHLTNASTRLEDGRATLRTLRGFLAGPRRYLILGGNNAEMRSMGIATTSGVATIHDGAVDVSKFAQSATTAVPSPGVPVPEGWDWLFGYLDPGSAYSNMVCSPNFPLTGETAAALSARNIYGAVDGVMYVDTVALQTMLSVVGPVTVEGVTYDGDNAVRLLVNENYLRFPNTDQAERRDAQGQVANAVFDALNTRSISLVKVAANLQDLASERHLAAWSSSPDEEKLWHDVGADGSRSAHDLLVTAQDLGASKLDFYVSQTVNMHVSPVGNDRRVDLSISLTNPARQERSPYIDGGSIYANPGEYGVYLVVFAPLDAFDFTYDNPPYTSSATDGPLSATTFTTRVPMDTTKTVHLSFTLPGHETLVNVIPAARVSPTTWAWDQYQFDDRRPTPLNVGFVAVGAVAPRPGWLLSGLLLLGLGVAVTGDAWGRPATRRSKLDANLGWWLIVFGLAMVVVQIAIFVTLR